MKALWEVNLEPVIWIGLLMISIVFHEVIHGYAAYLLGDDTAKRAGRLSLNPLKHLDPFWTLIFPLILYFVTAGRFFFAMAKPVPVDFRRLQEPKLDMALVGAAGPLANFILASAFSFFWKWTGNPYLLLGVYLNLGLGVFNLVPIPPLDGSRVLVGFLPAKAAYFYIKNERFGYLILFALYFTGLLSQILLPVIGILCHLLQVPVLNFES